MAERDRTAAGRKPLLQSDPKTSYLSGAAGLEKFYYL
jgi:hypothetical protein